MFGIGKSEGSFLNDFDSSSSECGVKQGDIFLTEDLEETFSRYKMILDSSSKKSKNVDGDVHKNASGLKINGLENYQSTEAPELFCSKSYFPEENQSTPIKKENFFDYTLSEPHYVISPKKYEANDLSKDLNPINKIHKKKYSNIDQQESSKYKTKRKHEDYYLRDDILYNRDGFLKNKENPPKKKEFYDYKYRSRGSRKSPKQNYSSEESSEYYTCKHFKKHKISKSEESARTSKKASYSKSKSSKRHHSDSESDIEFYRSRRREIKRRISEIEEKLKKYSEMKKKFEDEEKDEGRRRDEGKRRVEHSPKIVDNNLDEKKNPKSNQDNKLFDGSKKEYYCYVCQLDLNGIDCYDNHMKGKRHQKALNAQLLRPEALLYPAEGKNPLFRKHLDRNKRYKWKKITVTESRMEYNGSSADETDTSQSLKRRFKKSDSNTAWSVDENGEFYCKMCDAHMNNENTLNAHMVGKRHLKNEKKIRYGWFW